MIVLLSPPILPPTRKPIFLDHGYWHTPHHDTHRFATEGTPHPLDPRFDTGGTPHPLDPRFDTGGTPPTLSAYLRNQ